MTIRACGGLTVYKQNHKENLYFSKQIIEAIKGVFDYALTIVEAPMGYGKTIAVKENLSHDNAHILWQTIHDGSTYNFWNGFCCLLGELDEKLGKNLMALGCPSDKVSFKEAVKIINNTPQLLR